MEELTEVLPRNSETKFSGSIHSDCKSARADVITEAGSTTSSSRSETRVTLQCHFKGTVFTFTFPLLPMLALVVGLTCIMAWTITAEEEEEKLDPDPAPF